VAMATIWYQGGH